MVVVMVYTFNELGLKKTKITPSPLLARVAIESGQYAYVYHTEGEKWVEVPGRLKKKLSKSALPKVGDWVILDHTKSVIETICQRYAMLSRKGVGHRLDEQVMAANIDNMFIMMSLKEDFSIRRLERYLVMATKFKVKPIVLLNKSDLVSDAQQKAEQIKKIAPQVSCHRISCLQDTSLSQLEGYLETGVTSIVLGSSGVGKSTFINKVLGYDRQSTQELRDYVEKGRHTTTKRELIVIPNKGILIDTAGMRELQLWATKQDLDNTFDDISVIATGCQFNNCKHDREESCAVKEAVKNYALSKERLESYSKLRDEVDSLTYKKKLSRKIFKKSS